jgi:hypothetical protein
VAVIVTVADDAAVGVPLITPVDELIDKPAGNVPLVTAYVTAPVKLLGVNAVESVIAVPAVPDTVCDDGDTADAAYVKSVFAEFDCPPEVTMTLATPREPGGVSHVISLDDTKITFVQDWP